MLLAGSDDGIYALSGVDGDGETTAEKVLDAERVYRVRAFPAIDGVFATAQSGLYYSPDGQDWTALPVADQQVYAVTATPDGDRVYAGTRPSRVYAAEWDGEPPREESVWSEVDGFRALREERDWGIPRHDGVSQVRSLQTHPDAPDRIVAGIEVGGVHVSDDRGATWEARNVHGFDAPHTDDIHHVAMPDSETLVVSTGSGLYRTTDLGSAWDRLDAGHSQRYFRESFVHDGVVYAGGAPSSSSSWAADEAHALFECHDGETLEPVDSPAPEEVAIGWTAVDGDPLAATHGGTLLRRGADGWTAVGSVPTPGSVRGRYVPLLWTGD